LANRHWIPNDDHRRLGTQERRGRSILSFLKHAGLPLPTFDGEAWTADN
jgi:hypothetical protein